MKERIIVLMLTGIFFLNSALTAQPATHPYKEMETELLQLINDYRKSVGATPLKVNIFLSNIAERHSRDVANRKVEDGNAGFKDRTEKIYSQMRPVYSFAENFTSGRMTAKEILESWLSSPKHKKNVEGAYNYSGIGIAKSADSFFVTEIFILK